MNSERVRKIEREVGGNEKKRDKMISQNDDDVDGDDGDDFG